jgi:hypothetical protein
MWDQPGKAPYAGRRWFVLLRIVSVHIDENVRIEGNHAP